MTKIVKKAKVGKTAAKPAKGKTTRKPAVTKAAPARGKAPVKAKTRPSVKAAAKTKTAKPSKAARGMPEILRDATLKILDERQAEDVATFDVRGQSALADYIIIASGRNARQLIAIADYVRQAFLASGVRDTRVEGLPQGDWVLVDGGDVILHLFRPEVRRYYQIEDIWARTRRGA